MARVAWPLHRSLSCLPLLLAVFFLEQATSTRYEKGEEVWKNQGEKEGPGLHELRYRCARELGFMRGTRYLVNGRLSVPIPTGVLPLPLPPLCLSKIVLYANKVGPYFNPQETYHYFSLPVCRPSKVSTKVNGTYGLPDGGAACREFSS